MLIAYLLLDVLTERLTTNAKHQDHIHFYKNKRALTS